MCLGVPGRIETIQGDGLLRVGKVTFGGAVKEAHLGYVPEAIVGDYVIVHAGFAISTVDEDEAARIFDYLRQIGELAELEEANPSA
ncbi:MAG: HypC/HybG/HupF family hydrogenase formation chaperone [Gemmatimonadales bacterium]|jgi:hydrogenase expression/formation protein HypC|nr:HypC/HybG/HupF family hydrogenase formation chaperone [Candidatus Poribacteria bacterium]MBT3499664.1 HypC/HybG/HupF family hydrogenase formation chaperone [Gemmatimonadales bacterium]